MLKTFKVIDPKGILVSGKRFKKGDKVSGCTGSQIKAFLRFKQIEEFTEKAPSKTEVKNTK